MTGGGGYLHMPGSESLLLSLSPGVDVPSGGGVELCQVSTVPLQWQLVVVEILPEAAVVGPHQHVQTGDQIGTKWAGV